MALTIFLTATRWNEWVTLPIKYSDLPLSSQICFTVWDIAGPNTAAPVGGTTFRLFGKKRQVVNLHHLCKLTDPLISTLRRGRHRLLLWPDQEADGSIETRTPSKVPNEDETGRLEKLLKKYERGDLPKNDWLDKLAFRKLEEIHSVSLST